MTPYEQDLRDFHVSVKQWHKEGMAPEHVEYLTNNAGWLCEQEQMLGAELKQIRSYAELRGRGLTENQKNFYGRFTSEQLEFRFVMTTMVFKLRFPDKMWELGRSLDRLPETYDEVYSWNKNPIYKRVGFFSRLFG